MDLGVRGLLTSSHRQPESEPGSQSKSELEPESNATQTASQSQTQIDFCWISPMMVEEEEQNIPAPASLADQTFSSSPELAALTILILTGSAKETISTPMNKAGMPPPKPHEAADSSSICSSSPGQLTQHAGSVCPSYTSAPAQINQEATARFPEHRQLLHGGVRHWQPLHVVLPVNRPDPPVTAKPVVFVLHMATHTPRTLWFSGNTFVLVHSHALSAHRRASAGGAERGLPACIPVVPQTAVELCGSILRAAASCQDRVIANSLQRSWQALGFRV